MTTSNDPLVKKSNGFRKFLSWFLIIAFLGIGAFVYWKYFFVFGEGVKSGYLNYAVKKGKSL